MKSKIALAVLFLCALILMLVWMQGGFHSKIPAGTTPVADSPEERPETYAVTVSEAEGSVTVSGSVQARESARIFARVQGHVVELKAYAGDTVKKDELLLRIDNKEAEERRAQAAAALESARSDLSLAKQDFERFKSLFESDSIAEKQFDAAKARYQTAQSAVEKAKAALDEAETIVSYGKVRAPYAGIIGERYVNLGDLVSPGTQLYKVFQPGTEEMVAAVGEQFAKYLKVGKPVQVTVASIGLEQNSKIREVVPQRHERTRTITVKAPFEQTEDLRPGLYGALRFATEPSDIIAVPQKAVQSVGQLETVRVWEDNTIKTRHVKTGRTMDSMVEILSGLSQGDQVVLNRKE